MKNESLFSFKGQFLIAMPGLADPNFSGTVICMCEHTNQGGIGLVVNRIYPSICGQDIFSELKIEYDINTKPLPVYYGGPVHINEIFILHGPPFNWAACAMISKDLAMSNTRDILEAIAAGRGPESFMIILGCSGWGQNQVEAEIKENVWLSSPVSEEIIFDTPLNEKWDKAVGKMGIDPALFTGAAGHA